MEHNDSRHERAPANPPSGMEESTAGDSKLAQSIWQRYGGSPGIIPTAPLLALTRRVSLNIARLPLLRAVSQRWAPAAHVLPRARAALPYRSTPAGADEPALSTTPVRSFSETLLPQLGAASGRASRQPAALVPSSGEVGGSDRLVIDKARRRSVGPPMLLGEQTLPAHRAATGEQSVAAQGQMAAPDSSSDLSAGVLQRQLRGVADQVTQPTATSPGPVLLHGRVVSDTPLTARPPLTLMASAAGPSESQPPTADMAPLPATSDPLTALAGQGRSQRLASAQSPGQSSGEGSQPGAGQQAMPPAVSREDLGTTIVQRHLETPLRRDIPGQVLPSGPAPLAGHINATLQRSSGAPLTFHGSSRDPLSAAQPLMAHILGGIPPARLHTDPPAVAASEALGADAFTVGSDIFFAARQANFHHPRGVALLGHELTHVVQRRRQEGGSPAALEEAAVANESIILRHLTASAPFTAQQTLTAAHPAISGTPPGIGSPPGRGFSAPTNPFAAPPPLSSSSPLALAASAQRAVDSAPGAEARTADLSGAPPANGSPPGRGFSAPTNPFTAPLPLSSSSPLALAASVQRAVDSAPGAEATTALPEPPTGTAAESTPEVDVMRLADQVYELLVQRLASERERRGW